MTAILFDERYASETPDIQQSERPAQAVFSVSFWR